MQVWNILLFCVLYLVKNIESLWKPLTSNTFQMVLSTQNVDTDVDADIFDVDLFDVTDNLIKNLKSKGVKIICYFSAGSFEDWRPDKTDFPKSVKGHALSDWPHEYWLDIRNQSVRNIMKKRLDLAVERGCDGVDPDNVDGYYSDTGFNLTATDLLCFNKFLANEAHARNLSIGLKNNVEQIKDLVDYFDFAVNEQCYGYNECSEYEPFVNATKAVIHVEYTNEQQGDEQRKNEICNPCGNPTGFTTIIKHLNLDNWIFMCKHDIHDIHV